MKIPKIQVSGSWIKKIADELDTSENTVRMSLKYYMNSELGKKIRERALEMLKEESKKPIELIED